MDVDFSDDLDFDLTAMSGFLMNEAPDSAGHFYPPWATEPEATVKEEPMTIAGNTTAVPQPQPTRPGMLLPESEAKLDVIMGDTGTATAAAAAPAGLHTATAGTSRVAKMQVGTGATFRKTAAGGVTRRRSSSKEEQAKKRRERNRVLARRTRLRKKFFFQSLQQQVLDFLFILFLCVLGSLGMEGGDGGWGVGL